MDLDNVIVFDIETIGFLDRLNRKEDLHIFSFCKITDGIWKVSSTYDPNVIQDIIGNENNTLVCHNSICYDKPALLKMGWDFKAELICTLGLSYYLFPEKRLHGLADWGEIYGVPKPKIESWEGLSKEEYTNRCEQDVRINTNLWLTLKSKLLNIYEDDIPLIVNTIKYLNWKMYKLHIQELNPIKLDLDLVVKNIDFLSEIIKDKELILNQIMPPVIKYKDVKKPKTLFLKNGDLSKKGEAWIELCTNTNNELDVEFIKVEASSEEPNCQSSLQMKSFLSSLGWKPTIYKEGANGKVAQLRDDDKNLCPNIIKLIDKYPELEALQGLSVAQHRLGYLKGFNSKSDNLGYCRAWASGFTKTLRLKHVAPFVNLPKPSAEHGNLIRACMITQKGKVLIGADLSSIEDKTKQISIYKYDPDYVNSMNTKGWDAHLALGLKANIFTQDEVDFYKWFKSKDKEGSKLICPEVFNNVDYEELFHKLDKKRASCKTTNYACTYGAGVPTIQASLKSNRKEAELLHKGYWDMNWAVKKFASERVVKKVKGVNFTVRDKKQCVEQDSMWVWNEFTRMWLYLKNEKDIFSALNQNNGVKIFDTWGYFLYQDGINFSAEWHDEYLWSCDSDKLSIDEDKISKAIIKVNKVFNAPIPIECDYKIGESYDKVH